MTPRPGTLIAARSLADDPRAAFRAVSGLVLALFITTVAVVAIATQNAKDLTRWASAAEANVLTDQISASNQAVGNSGPVVGYAAAGLARGLLASLVAFSPSFAFILLGARRFDQIRADRNARAFLAGAGPAAIGAIFGSAIPLTRALTHDWQYAILAAALGLLLLLRRGVVLTLLGAAAAGAIIALAVGL